MNRKQRSATGIFFSSFLKTFLRISNPKGVNEGFAVADNKTAGCGGLSWVDLSHISVNHTAQPAIHATWKQNSVSSLCSCWTKARSHLQHLHLTFPQKLKRQKQKLPVISRENNNEKEIKHRAVFLQRQDRPLSTTQSKRSPAAETCPVGENISVNYPVNVTFFGAFTHIRSSVTRVYSSAFQWFLPPFRSCLPSLSRSRVSLSSLPFRTEIFSGRNSDPSSTNPVENASGLLLSAWSQVLERAGACRLSLAKVRIG